MQCVEVSCSSALSVSQSAVMDRVSERKAIFEIGKTIDAAAAAAAADNAVTRTSPLPISLRYPV